MKKYAINILLLIWFTGIMAGCSTKKNTLATRAAHNLSAHYNVFFNATQSYRTGLERIDETIPDDFTHTLPVFKSTLAEASKVATSEMELAITKCNKLISIHSITKSPPRRSNNSERYKKFASKGEYNQWVDDSYVLMGKASYCNHDFHRAIENFNYVIRRFPDQATRYDAFLGMARAYTETGEYAQALDIFNSLSRDQGFPRRLSQELHLAQAHYYLKDNQPDVAITHLKVALESPFRRSEKLRINYLLAQLLALTDRPAEASAQYLRVIKMRPDYQMAFNARISRMEIDGGDHEDIDVQLQKMLDNSLNQEYRDRIYYAKAQIALKQGRKQDAVAALKNSVLYSVSNPNQRALSSLSVARLFFEANEYQQSSCYYDSAVAVIDATYPGYAEITARANALGRLAKDLNAISREDSLQRLALMSPADRNALIGKIISDLKKGSSEKVLAENSATADQNYFRAQQYRSQTGPNNNQNLWYFYNTSTVGIGKSDFQKIWGKRKLEDNWRRKNKQSSSENAPDEVAEAEIVPGITEVKKKVGDPESFDFYLQDIPVTDSLIAVSNDIIKAALFSAGRIYRTEFADFKRSAETLEELNRRFVGSIYELPAFFELYQLYQADNNQSKTAEYREKIIRQYPDSKYAQYLLNPNYFTDLEEKKEAVEKKYDEVLRLFQSYDYSKAAGTAAATLAMNPDSTLLPKVQFISVVANGSSQSREEFARSLDQYVKTFPRHATAAIAKQIKELIVSNSLADYKQLLAKGYVKEEIVNEELKGNKSLLNDDFNGKYSYDENLFHYYVIAFSNEAGVDVNRLIYDIASYNLDYYTDTDFDIESIGLDSKTRLVVVRSVPNKEESLIYFRSIMRKRPVFQALKGVEYVNFVTSSSNYRTMLAEKDYLDYLQFFTKNYSSYTGADVPADQLPDPAELLSKVRKQEDPVEKGKFVVLQPLTPADSAVKKAVTPVGANKAAYQGPYSLKPAKDLCYTIIFMKAQTDQSRLYEAFKTFNETSFRSPVMKVTVESLDVNRGLLTVCGLGDKPSALAYMQKSNSDKTLSEILTGNNFRSFIISDENLAIFKQEKNLLQYMEFYNRME